MYSHGENEHICDLTITKGCERCYQVIIDFINYNSVFFQAYHKCMIENASNSILKDDLSAMQNKIFTLESAESGRVILIPFSPLEEIFFGKTNTNITMGLFEGIQKPPKTIITTKGSGVKALAGTIDFAIFSNYVSRAIEWYRTISTSYENWPPTLNFARVIRNAAVHGGAININNEMIKVSWRSLSYSNQDYGRLLNSGDISSADLFLLIFDLEKELNLINAPNPLP